MTVPPAAILPRIAALGPFFAFEVYDDEGVNAGGGPGDGGAHGWRPLDELVREDSGVLRDRVAAARAHLAAGSGLPPGAVELRVAASVTHLGLAARLLSPFLALTALLGAPPRLELAAARWRPVPGGLFPLALPRRLLEPGAPTAAPDAFLDGPVRQLAAATGAFSVSARVLRGNVASAVHGAATAATAADPPLRRGVRAAAGELLAHPLLRDAHTAADGRFRRTSCCLIYRARPGAPATPAALCGDCVLAGRGRP